MSIYRGELLIVSSGYGGGLTNPCPHPSIRLNTFGEIMVGSLTCNQCVHFGGYKIAYRNGRIYCKYRTCRKIIIT